MSDDLPTTVFGLECNTTTLDADGAEHNVEDITGWDSADILSSSLNPTGRPGLALGTFRQSGRPMRVIGSSVAATQDDAWDLYNRLCSILALNEVGDVIVYEPTPKMVEAVISGKSLVSKPVRRIVHWDLSITAAFPFKTALTPTVTALAAGASTTVTNNGNAAAYPVVTTTSSGTVDLVIGGRHFVTSSLPSGAVIDMWARSIQTAGGVDISPWPKSSASEWLAFPAGATGVDQDGTAALSLAVYDTFN